MTCINTCREQIFIEKNGCVKKMIGRHIKRVGFLLPAKELIYLWTFDP